MPVFRFVHGIEVANGGNTTRENAFAYRVAAILGKPMTAGSDAHSRSGIGACATAFPQPLRDREHLLALLHAGRSTPLVAGTAASEPSARPTDRPALRWPESRSATLESARHGRPHLRRPGPGNHRP